MLRILLQVVCCTVAFLAQPAMGASADAWPSRSIRLVVPFAPGGATDVTARLLAERLRSELAQTVVVDNRAGGGGNIGAENAAKSPGDGYTMLLATSSHVTNISLYKTLRYDFVRDLAPVSQVAFIPNLLVVHPSVPATNLAGFIKVAKDSKNPLLYGSGGNGTSQHLSAALFNSMVHGNMQHVPYKGGAPAATDLVAGQIHAIFAPLVEVLGFVESRRLRALGITTRQRSPVLPDVPTIGEVLPGYEVALWNGIFVPAGTSPDIVNRLHAAIAKVLAEPDFRKRLAEQGSTPFGRTPAEFREFVATETEKWKTLVKISGAQAE
jgi:tripartite-type tricarboxylate transporter receptor subunit TctC